jgi:perosamine synthetase
MIPVARPSLGAEEVEAVSKVIESGMLAQGPRVEEFEIKFARYCNTAHAVAVNSGTAALHAILAAMGIGPGDEVIVPSFTFFATASSVCMCGATPVFADVEEDTFNISTDSMEEQVTKKSRAVIGVHLFGQPFAIRPVVKICEDAGISLVEDAAQAHGALYHRKKVGSSGAAACFSFYPTKNMTAGEGGMVTTNNPALSEKVRQFINHGQAEKYHHTCIGYNYRMADLSAAIGLAQLNKLDAFNAKRREIATFYNEHIHSPGIILPKVAPGVEHVYHQYVIRVTKECPLTRDQLAIALHEKGIGATVHYPVTLPRQPALLKYSDKSHCPIAERLTGEVLSLPVHPLVNKEERTYIAACINEVA